MILPGDVGGPHTKPPDGRHGQTRRIEGHRLKELTPIDYHRGKWVPSLLLQY